MFPAITLILLVGATLSACGDVDTSGKVEGASQTDNRVEQRTSDSPVGSPTVTCKSGGKFLRVRVAFPQGSQPSTSALTRIDVTYTGNASSALLKGGVHIQVAQQGGFTVKGVLRTGPTELEVRAGDTTRTVGATTTSRGPNSLRTTIGEPIEFLNMDKAPTGFLSVKAKSPQDDTAACSVSGILLSP